MHIDLHLGKAKGAKVKMKKRGIVLLLTACMMTGLISGCGSASSDSSARMENNEVPTDSERKESHEPVDRVILANGSRPYVDGIWLYQMDGTPIGEYEDFIYEGGLSEGKFVFSVFDKLGILSVNGEFISDPVYEESNYKNSLGDLRGLIYSEGLAVIIEDGKYGYMDENCNVIIEPQFDDADRFSSGLACVKVGEKYGFIDHEGNMVLEPCYDTAYSFSNGLAKVEHQDKGWGIINTSGEMVLGDGVLSGGSSSTEFEFYDGLALVEVKSHYGYINEAGEMVIEPIYSEAYPFVDGIARVKVGDVYGYINTKGEYFLEPQFNMAQDFSDGLAYVGRSRQDDGVEEAYIDTLGNPVIVFDKDAVIDPFPFSDGMALVHKNTGEKSTPYYIDKEGNEVVNLSELDAGAHYNQGYYTAGYAVIVLNNNNLALIDKEGKRVFDDEFSWINDDYIESDGIVILSTQDGRLGVAKLDGTWVVEPSNYDEILVVDAGDQ